MKILNARIYFLISYLFLFFMWITPTQVNAQTNTDLSQYLEENKIDNDQNSFTINNLAGIDELTLRAASGDGWDFDGSTLTISGKITRDTIAKDWHVAEISGGGRI